MDEAEQVSRLVGEIYDAALDRALWPSVLEKSCSFVQGKCAGLVAQDLFLGAGQFYFSWGLDPTVELYLEEYIRLNTAGMIALCSTKPGDVISTELLMPYDEFLASRFYVEWAKPQGFCDIVGVLLEKSSTSTANLGIVRHQRQGLADEATRRRMALLVPHFQRSVNIGKLDPLAQSRSGCVGRHTRRATNGIVLGCCRCADRPCQRQWTHDARQRVRVAAAERTSGRD